MKKNKSAFIEQGKREREKRKVKREILNYGTG